MSDITKISWADSTFNPWMGCTKVSPACDHCYAERQTKRMRVEWGSGKPRVRTVERNWKKVALWNDKRFMECRACGWRGECASELIGCGNCGSSEHLNDTRRRVFCASLADWLDNEVPIEWLVDLLDLIRRTPNLDWLLLTKRIGNWRARVQEAANYRLVALILADGSDPNRDALWQWIKGWLAGDAPANVWIGSTVVNQTEADRDVPKLLAMPARIRFLSIEPMLGPISFEGMFASERINDGTNAIEALDWIICGGESGPHARDGDSEWYRSLMRQCRTAGVAYHLKQITAGGERISMSEWSEDLRIQEFPHVR